jgi:hypothetical protein
MTDPYDHLFAAYREQADLPDEARIDWIRRDRWISLPQAEAAIGRLEDLLTYPPRGDAMRVDRSNGISEPLRAAHCVWCAPTAGARSNAAFRRPWKRGSATPAVSCPLQI